MSSPFVAEIRIFGFNFAPTGWAQCNGQLLPISQNTALFSLLGTMYGGDGKSTFGLPNLEASVAVGQGQGPGLSEYFIGQEGGSQFITLLQTEMPAHSHSWQGDEGNGLFTTPANAFLGSGNQMYLTPAAVNANLAPQALALTGGSQPHNNMMPYLTLNFCIAMQGVFPARP
jgi:microcystin-dependent protein